MHSFQTILISFCLAASLPLAGQLDRPAAGELPGMPELDRSRIFHTLMAGNLLGQANGEFVGGMSLRYSVHYRFNPYLCAGLGVGAETYAFEAGKSFYPLSAELRGFLAERAVSPYYHLSLGYGFAFAGDDEVLDEVKGGGMALTALGLKFKGQEWLDFAVQLGLQHQWGQTTYLTDNWWGGPGRRTNENHYFQRIHLQLGLFF